MRGISGAIRSLRLKLSIPVIGENHSASSWILSCLFPGQEIFQKEKTTRRCKLYSKTSYTMVQLAICMNLIHFTSVCISSIHMGTYALKINSPSLILLAGVPDDVTN